jgi:hypothetical protein
LKRAANKSNDVGPPDPGRDRTQRMHVNTGFAHTLQHEDQVGIIDSELNIGPSSPPPYEEDFLSLDDDDDNGDDILGDSPPLQSANDSQTGQTVSRAKLCQ